MRFSDKYPERRGVGCNDFDTGPGIVCDAEELPADGVLQRPAAFSLGRDPLCGGDRDQMEGGEVESVTVGRTFWLSCPKNG